MHKFNLIVLVAVGIFLGSIVSASATGKGGCGDAWYQDPCPVEEQTGNHVTNTNTNENDNRNSNSNSNRNTNTNLNNNMQGQDQDQDQAQIQLQLQKSEANNEGNTQKINIEGDKYEAKANHIQATIGSANATLADHDQALTVKTFSSLLEHVAVLSIDMAKRAAKGASDIVVESAILWEPAVQLDIVVLQSNKGSYLGSLTLLSDGPDATMDQMVARAAVEAMKLGATDILVTDDEGKFLEAVQYGIGFGGAASAASSSGDVVVAPGFGTGYSKAKSNNELRPALFVVLYHNSDSIVE